MDRSASSLQSGVLLVDWDNLVGAILRRGATIERAYVDRLWSSPASGAVESFATPIWLR